jgi:hypothetical protein
MASSFGACLTAGREKEIVMRPLFKPEAEAGLHSFSGRIDRGLARIFERMSIASLAIKIRVEPFCAGTCTCAWNGEGAPSHVRCFRSIASGQPRITSATF